MAWTADYSRILKPEKKDLTDLIKNGKYVVLDPHVHTYFSEDVIRQSSDGILRDINSPLVLFMTAINKGMTHVAFTDHDTMEGYYSFLENSHLLRSEFGYEGLINIISGVELNLGKRKIRGKEIKHSIHSNVYELNERQFNELSSLIKKDKNLESFAEYCSENNLPFALNHPCWGKAGEKVNSESIDTLASLFPVLECNMHRNKKKNNITMYMADKHDKGIWASTDSHLGNPGDAYTAAEGKDFREFYENVKNGNVYIQLESLDKEKLVEEGQKLIKLMFTADPEILKSRERNIELGSAIKYLMRLAENERVRKSEKLTSYFESLFTKMSNTGISNAYNIIENITSFKLYRQMEADMKSYMAESNVFA